MGDMIDMFRDRKAAEQSRREEAWANRGTDIERIVALGFVVRTMSAESRHLRIPMPGDGWFDWWPSTGRWAQSRRPGGRRGQSGFGVDGLIAVLERARRARGG